MNTHGSADTTIPTRDQGGSPLQFSAAFIVRFYIFRAGVHLGLDAGLTVLFLLFLIYQCCFHIRLWENREYHALPATGMICEIPST